MRPKYMRADFPMMRFNRTSYQRLVIYPTHHAGFTEAAGYLLGFCLKRHNLLLYAFTLFFNHHHGALGHPDGDDSPEVKARFADFWTEFHLYLYRLVTLCGWPHGCIMNTRERTHDAPTLDADQILTDLSYIVAQSVKAGLFETSAHYPGLCFLPENVLEPKTFARNSLIHRLDPERQLFIEDEVTVKLSIPKPLRHLDPAEYVEVFEARVFAYEDEVRADSVSRLRGRAACKSARMGICFEKHKEKLRRRGKAVRSKPKGPRDPYTSDPALKRAYFKERQQFWEEHRQAVEEVRSGKTNVCFPAGTYGRRNQLNCRVSVGGAPCWAGLPAWHPH